ncbi:hypothetical protein FH972_025167 [Carpinus fangiana]|uniref:Uncharacterized protein n=1 Tax=Carpinus fangiana TaxID=176857 RepID=A0A5N6L0K1_9ROSI|nr:hypothetical protein FH972_025167 [Carpinus fangiana]
MRGDSLPSSDAIGGKRSGSSPDDGQDGEAAERVVDAQAEQGEKEGRDSGCGGGGAGALSRRGEGSGGYLLKVPLNGNMPGGRPRPSLRLGLVMPEAPDKGAPTPQAMASKGLTTAAVAHPLPAQGVLTLTLQVDVRWKIVTTFVSPFDLELVLLKQCLPSHS